MMRFAALGLAASFLLAPPLARLQPDFQPLLSDFAESNGKVRLILFLSPT
jgi:hypothetical protein